MTLKKAFLTAITLASVSSFAFQIEVGGGPQREKFAGWVQYEGDKVDLKNDLHIHDKTRYFVYLDIRHNISLILIPLPNIRIEYLRMDSSGTGTVSKSFTFGNLKIAVNDRVYSKFKFHQLDTTLYYTPLDLKIINASWGFGAKVIDFKATIKSLTTQQSETKSATIPLPYLYGRVGINLPFVHVYGDIKGIAAGSKNYFYDWRVAAGLSYSFAKIATLSLDAGYRYQRYRVDNVDNVSADVKARGPFAALTLSVGF